MFKLTRISQHPILRPIQEHEWESAGVLPTGIMHPLTARVLEERGADASGFAGRHVEDLDLGAFDHVVLIGTTAQACAPDSPAGVEVHHWDVADPFELRGSEAAVLAGYQECAAELTRCIRELVGSQACDSAD